MTGRDLSKLELVFAPDGVREDVDELVALLGEALGDREVPVTAVRTILEAVAIIVMYPDAEGRPADVVVADAEERFAKHPIIARERRRMTIRYGYDVADAALQELQDVGQSMIAALGARHLPHEACRLLGGAASQIADLKTGVGA